MFLFPIVTRDEFVSARTKELIMDITTAVNEIVEGMTYEEEFYKNLLESMVVEHIDVYLNLLPYK